MTTVRQYIYHSRFRHVLFCLFAGLLISTSAFAQTTNNDKPEEISVMLNVQRVGSTEVDAFIQEQNVYLSITEVFDFLKIRNTLSSNVDSVSGFFIYPNAYYLIAKDRNRIFYHGKTTVLHPSDLIRTESGLFLKSGYFETVFGLTCVFDFRSLTVNLQSKIELPAVREMQLAIIRKNIGLLKGERKADTTIGRRFPMFRLGMADWSIYSSQLKSGTDTRLGLSMGAMVAGGETNVSLNVAPGQPLDERTQYYRWRYVNNDNPWLKQISVGKLYPESISTLSSPLKGFSLTNTPTTYRKSFGTYILSGTTEKEWTVELYVNNILVNYTKSDASGFYSFEVPMVYGNSNVKLRFYGPWGEEQTKEQSIVIPFNFLPEHQFEYNVTGGIAEGNESGLFARASLKYGVANFLTLGGGMEYFSAVTSGHYIPYTSAALRLFSKVILYGEHAYGVRTKGILNYRHPSNFQVDINYTKYEPQQTAVKYLEEQKAVFSMPFHARKFTAFSRLTISQTDDFKKKITSGEFLLSSFFSGYSSNFTTYAIFNQGGNPLIRSNLSITALLPKQIRFTQQVQYEYVNKNFSMLRSEVEKNVFKTGFINLAYEKNMVAQTNNFSIGFRLNLSGLQAAFSTLHSNQDFSTYESLRGSIAYDDNIEKLRFNNQSNVGRGGISVVPFLDLNCNGKRDSGEQKVCGLKLKINGGRITHCNNDTTIQILGLEAYNNYLLELDNNSFDNVAWQIKKTMINVVADPNYFKNIEVPVAVLGEAEGKVLMQSKEGTKGQGRIIVRFFKAGKLVAKVLTESDGYFDYMGFAPGTYTAEIDKDQLVTLGLVAEPAKVEFTMKPNKEGEFLKGLQFVLHKKEE